MEARVHFHGCTLVALILLGLVFVACDTGRDHVAAKSITGGSTSVLLIILDTTRADHLGAWGYDQDTSPEIDRLAAGGVRFANFFSSAPWTRPSIASLLTGLYPRSTGVYEERFDRGLSHSRVDFESQYQRLVPVRSGVR
jgi:predicted AlkP superfamily pyrophosphatase or phosphodiesterase